MLGFLPARPAVHADGRSPRATCRRRRSRCWRCSKCVLGPLWAWLGAGEVPAAATVGGGALVLAALVANELAALRGRRR
ncbi:MAG: hypothetical protein MZW92_48160 [Comamonadaceae bacterium]|nr:hypothetical protein [Comamonadaceae bacterium]